MVISDHWSIYVNRIQFGYFYNQDAVNHELYNYYCNNVIDKIWRILTREHSLRLCQVIIGDKMHFYCLELIN